MWMGLLQQFNLHIKHEKGKANKLADVL